MDILKDTTLPQGWIIPDEKVKRALEKELTTEVGPEHVLYKKNCTTFTRSEYSDDVIYLVHEDSVKFAFVHLTFSSKQEIHSTCPYTKISEDFVKVIEGEVA